MKIVSRWKIVSVFYVTTRQAFAPIYRSPSVVSNWKEKHCMSDRTWLGHTQGHRRPQFCSVHFHHLVVAMWWGGGRERVQWLDRGNHWRDQEEHRIEEQVPGTLSQPALLGPWPDSHHLLRGRGPSGRVRLDSVVFAGALPPDHRGAQVWSLTQFYSVRLFTFKDRW